MARNLHGNLIPERLDAEHEGANPLTASVMYMDEKCLAHARECVRLAGLTDDQEVRDQLIALARDWLVAARKKKEEEEDDDSKVLVFPSAVERSRRGQHETSRPRGGTSGLPSATDIFGECRLGR
jgi:hypothetical protein